ncbi:DUF72 domain-containing protein [Aliiglaciecola sp. LCG003]|uniref:DUF72 domain-containing protein n=1 Tax=Aliiglaciecola sp. LCG003 TaxID=3053655 RepID=UPI0025722B28|nr:DUF72 domain-containing protein [Aliiglaciecola sp. LCG003]WJG08117.1 DUF72 domain-containing protein [Aliiglaciecola sp. LCG003]
MQQPQTTLNYGCPMWSHPQWFGTLYANSASRQHPLRSYQSWFNSVEGNTSFYQLPSEDTMLGWKEQVDGGFSFTFKLPRDISHSKNLNHNSELLAQTVKRFALLEDQLGCVMLQLPSSFGPNRFDELKQFLLSLPKDMHIAVEVRDLAWFDKADNELRLNQLLTQLSINRVIMDTRGLFACHNPSDTLTLEVQSKKPKIPTHVVATGSRPIVRFVGHPNLHRNAEFLAPWVDKIVEWQNDNISPYIFFHMPDNAQAPWLAEQFFNQLSQSYPNINSPKFDLPKCINQQMSIF